MKRRLLAAAWIAGATVPLLLGTMFVVGCCVLPFHNVVHKLMPLCQMAANVMRGDHAGQDATPVPARERQEPVRKAATEVPVVFRLAGMAVGERALAPSPATRYRSFITLGAVRCDRD